MVSLVRGRGNIWRGGSVWFVERGKRLGEIKVAAGSWSG